MADEIFLPGQWVRLRRSYARLPMGTHGKVMQVYHAVACLYDVQFAEQAEAVIVPARYLEAEPVAIEGYPCRP